MKIKNLQTMRKVIAAINMTIDGYCDHTSGIADAEIHQHYTGLLNDAGIILYGRITFKLMEYWKPFLNDPDADKNMVDFANAIDKIPKIVFSNSLQETGWDTAKLATREPEEELRDLKQQPGKDILIGSPGLISKFTHLNVIDEYQLCIHPVITGKGLRLFKQVDDQIIFKLIKTKTFNSGAIIQYFKRQDAGND